MTSFWFNEFFMDDLSYLLVVRKKYTNVHGKDSNFTNAIDINIIGSCGDAAGSAGGRVVAVFVVLVVSLFALVVSSLPFFHHLKYFLLTYSCSFPCLCELPQHVLGPL